MVAANAGALASVTVIHNRNMCFNQRPTCGRDEIDPASRLGWLWVFAAGSSARVGMLSEGIFMVFSLVGGLEFGL